MNGQTQGGAPNFIGYDYMQLSAKAPMLALMLDAYQSMGWQPEQNSRSTVNIQLKRKRKIVNKTELTRLQRHFEACLGNLYALEKTKTQGATMLAIAIGIAGTAFMAGAVFAITATPPIVWLCVLLSLPGAAGWALPVWAYRKAVRHKTKSVETMLEKQYDEIAEICEKASKLL